MTVEDVAKVFGCSVATVSRALNDKPGVGADLRQRITDYCNAQGFAVNALAKSLQAQRSRIIGAVLPSLASSIYQRLNDSIQDTVEEHGFTLITATSRYDLDKECDQAISLMQMGIEGLVLVGTNHRKRLVEVARNRGIPIVNTYAYVEGGSESTIGCDDHQVMASVVDCLVGLGHSKIGYISGISADNDRVQRRMKGVEDRLCHFFAGNQQPHFHVESEYSIQGGYVAMQRLLSEVDRCTAVVCGSDVLAFGALSACRDLGVRVPEDMSIIGFDNQDFASHLSPALSSVETPSSEMGRYAAKILLDKIERDVPLASLKLKANIVIRDSTSRPAAAQGD